jgi:mRNA interferase RelE/StbE
VYKTKHYEIRLTKEAVKDIKKLTPRLRDKLQKILKNVVMQNPHSGKKLVAELKGCYSLRLSYQDRIVYTIDEANKIVYVHKAKRHYSD